MSDLLPTRPSKIIAVHRNFRARALELGGLPEQPTYFLKPPSALSVSGQPLVRPAGSHTLVAEGEIALVIGIRCKHLTPDEGWSAVHSVLAANDAAVHDFRHADAGGNLRSKGIDGFAPVGVNPISAAGIDPHALRVRTWIDDTLVQEDTTANLVFSFGYLIADLTRLITLEPGDLILSGSPAGVPTVNPGETVSVEVDSENGASTGRLSNPVIESHEVLPGWGHLPRPWVPLQSQTD